MSEGQHVSSESAQSREPRIPLAICLIVVGVIAAIFMTYEIVERLWLTDADMSTLHLLHIIRGIGASVAVGLIVGGYFLRKGGSIFPSADVTEDQVQQRQGESQKQIIHYSTWFIQMRWLACVVSIILIVVTITVLDYLEKRAFWPLVISVAVLCATNITYTVLLRRRLFISHLREVQIALDLIILTFMLHYSGGIENPLFLTYIFHVIIGGILLDRRKCYAIVLIAFVLFGAMAFLEMSDIVEHYTLLIFPHGEEGDEIVHAAHQPLYVWSIVGLQLILMSLTAHFTTDIMNRLRSEERHARLISQRLSRVLEASGAGFTILDRRLRPLWLNRQIRKWLNLSDASIVRSPSMMSDWIGGEAGPAMKTFEDGQVRVVDRPRVDSSGDKHHFRVTVAPLLDSKGDVHQVVELTQDITEQKLLETEVMHSSKMAALGVMAAGVAHEIGNPLASISTRLRLLQEQHDEVFVRDSIGLLEKEIGRIGRILHSVSRLARPGKVDWSACQINSILKDTLNVLRFDQRAGNCKIQSDLCQSLPETTGSKDELSQVFLNLGLNALEKMPHGGILTVRTSVAADLIEMSFADTGEGMSEEVVSKIFTPFFSTKEQGLGLGLYIAHNIIDAHGGRIKVRSELGAGTVITLTLPVRAAKA
ncbi:MAG: two-component system sensor histidine kinase NtrB [Planctomycetota bacterium]